MLPARKGRAGGRGWTAKVGACLALCCLTASAGQAHDYWLEPGPALASKGDELVLHLEMGDRLKIDEERPLQKDHVSRFDLYGDRAVRRDLLATGQDGQMPAAKARLESGSALVVMDRRPRQITMERDRFNRYLADEGLEAIIAQRARLGQTDGPGHEVYLRFLKALIQEKEPAAATANTLYKRRVGQRLEILLENNPGKLNPDGELTVKVLFEDKPLAGARVFACRRGAENQPPYVVQATTSASGLAEFKLDQPGLWLVRMVHMRAASGGGKGEPVPPPQWESFWAAYTFLARYAPPSSAPAPAQTANPPAAAQTSEREEATHQPGGGPSPRGTP